jgi:Xaa-Pro aminopeptidase
MRCYAASKNLYIKNRKKLLKQLDQNSLAIILPNDQMLRTGDQYYPYRQNSDLLYLSGINQEETILTLCPGHPEKKMREILFIRKSDPKLETWEGHKLTLEEASEQSGIENVKYVDDMAMVLRDQVLHSEKVFVNTNEYIKLSEKVPSKSIRFILDLKQDYPLHQYYRLAPLVTRLRMKKEPEEIELIRKACGITRDALLRVMNYLRPGIMEYEVEAEITHEYLRQGANGHGYQPIIASGKNATVLHYLSNNQECKDGDLLLMDVGAEYGNYSADCTRTVPVNGKFTPRQRDLYDASLKVLNQAMTQMKIGSSISKIHKQVCKLWEEEHIKLGLYSRNDVKNQKPTEPMFMKYYMHGTSHFLGLDVHDVGEKEVAFEEGMVLTCEPAIYIPEESIGVRLENDILITRDGPVNLMEDIPIDPDEVEEIMNNQSSK